MNWFQPFQLFQCSTAPFTALRRFKVQGLRIQCRWLKPPNPLDPFGAIGLRFGLYSYRFDSETVRSSGCTLTVVGRNE
jgi:hypothetical protein